MERTVKPSILERLRNGEIVGGGILLYFDLQPYLAIGEKIDCFTNTKWEGGPNTWNHRLVCNTESSQAPE